MTTKALTHSVAILWVATWLSSCSSSDGVTGSSQPPKDPTPSCAGPFTGTSPPPARSCSATIPFDPTDPLWGYQWHLDNLAQTCGTAGEDINVDTVWATLKGNGVRVVVVDNGMELTHEDLSPNVVAGSYDYSDGDANPDSGNSDHGTAVGGVIAARDLNNLGMRGVAPRAELIAYNLLDALTSANAADAMTRNAPSNFVSSNSWGAPDGYGTLDAADANWLTAIATGLANGRSNRGLIYVWAGGNGAPVDNSNYDGQANRRGVIAVGATTDTGTKAYYSERGANLWVSAPGGSSSCIGRIATTDASAGAGYNPVDTGGADLSNQNYSKCFGGTSAATPVVSGVVALVLQARPTLTWRDVPIILARSARKNDVGNAGWSNNGAGHPVNHDYGFGVVDAQAAVTLASTWTNVGAEVVYGPTTASPNLRIPDNNCTGVSSTITVNGSGISEIEWVEVTFTAANHTYSGDLDIALTAPSGTVSRLAERHPCSGCSRYSGWVFGSARHLDEPANGNWTLTVKDLEAVDVGTFQSWSLKIYGH